MKKQFLLFVLMLLPMIVNSSPYVIYYTNIDGIFYDFNNVTMTATVTGKGDYYESYGSNYPDDYYSGEYSGSIEIPSEVNYKDAVYRVTSIREYSFCRCSGLTSITIPNSVTSIGDGAFSGCSGLTTVTIPNSVTSIGGNAFWGCSGLTSIAIPSSVTSIGGSAFENCSGLTSIVVDSENKNYDSRNNCNAIIETSSNELMAGCMNTVIPNGVTSISYHIFYNCYGLTSVTIPNSVTTIDRYAFEGCTGLTSIRVESGNTKFDSRNNCNAIIDSNNTLILGCKNTIIPNSVTSIGENAFLGCTGLVYITLPSNLTSIGWNAFSSCYYLTDIYCKAKSVPRAVISAFSNPENITLHVPNESLDAYKTTVTWKDFGNFVPLYDRDLQASEKCPKPTISIVDGKFIFNCETSFFSYHWSISTQSGTKGQLDSYSDPAITLNYNKITLNVFATKSGYLPSDVATYEFSGLAGDVNNDGVVNVADHVKLSEIIMDQK